MTTTTKVLLFFGAVAMASVTMFIVGMVDTELAPTVGLAVGLVYASVAFSTSEAQALWRSAVAISMLYLLFFNWVIALIVGTLAVAFVYGTRRILE